MTPDHETTEFHRLQEQFSDDYRKGRHQQAVAVIFKALEQFYDHPEQFTFSQLQSADVRPAYRLEYAGLAVVNTFLARIGPTHRFARTKRLRNRLTFLDEALLRYPGTLLLAAAKTQVLLDMDQPVEALAQARATLNIKPNSPLCEHLLEKVLKQLERQKLLPKVKLNTFENAFLADMRQFFCPMPFTNFEVFNDGQVYVCCGGFLPAPIGNIFHQNYEQIWNSETARRIRRSVLEGDFSYCSRSCEMITGQCLPRKAGVKDPIFKKYIEARQTEIAEGPRFLNMAHDYTCNLYCPSCRRKPRAADAAMQARLEDARKRVVDQVLPHVSELQIAGDGDPFASRHYRAILACLDKQNYPHLRLRILTNGVLFTPQAWDEFSNIHPLLETVQVSVDAATAETYAKVRRGGDFAKLLDNLRFLAGKRAEKAFDCLQLNFVVQKINFPEMPDFVRLGKQIGVDRIVFQHLHNQLESFGAEEFRDANVFSPDHPAYHQLQRILADPILSLKNPRVVLQEMGTEEFVMELCKDTHNQPAESGIPGNADRTGWWWIPGCGGTGIAIADNAEHLHIAINSFNRDGRPVWHECMALKSGPDFQGDLVFTYYNAAINAWESKPAGRLQLFFSGTDAGTICMKNCNHPFEAPIARYMQGAPDPRPVRGWYRTRAGRKAMIFMELRDGALTGGFFFFQRQGAPMWLVFWDNKIDCKNNLLKTSLFAYEDGQVLGRAFQPAREKKAGEMVLDLSDPEALKCSGWMARQYA